MVTYADVCFKAPFQVFVKAVANCLVIVPLLSWHEVEGKEPAGSVGQLMALLRRFQAEAAREEARVMSAQLAEREEQSRKAMVIEIDFESLEAELLEAA